MKANLYLPITNAEEAKLHLEELNRYGETYHPEDSAFTAVFPDWVEEPTEEECLQLDRQMHLVYEFADFDPCEYIMGLPFFTEEVPPCQNIAKND